MNRGSSISTSIHIHIIIINHIVITAHSLPCSPARHPRRRRRLPHRCPLSPPSQLFRALSPFVRLRLFPALSHLRQHSRRSRPPLRQPPPPPPPQPPPQPLLPRPWRDAHRRRRRRRRRVPLCAPGLLLPGLLPRTPGLLLPPGLPLPGLFLRTPGLLLPPGLPPGLFPRNPGLRPPPPPPRPRRWSRPTLPVTESII
ncbi:hypothetical protein T492DRAFT_1135955 [Pavlovales sp. CCMP2436]|nr:hypothetical protein T492DRAFT_1135955 [Pavlovales sp. CCMP2436]